MRRCDGAGPRRRSAAPDRLRPAAQNSRRRAGGDRCALRRRGYRITKVTGDRYASEWPREQFGKCGITYEPSAKPKSELYIDLLPLINSARTELLDHAKLISQLTALERRTARGGRDSIDYPPGAHDDIANAAAGVAAAAVSKYGAYDPTFRGWQPDADDPDDPDGAKAWRSARLAAYLNSGGLIRL
jgi:hypothetical protein